MVCRLHHAHELERRKLDNGKIVRLHLLCQRQKRRSDVSAEPDRVARVLQNFGNKRCRCRLAVRAGHSNDSARTDGEKRLHFARHHRAALAQLPQRRNVRMHAGRTEHNVRLHAVQVPVSHMERRAHAL